MENESTLTVRSTGTKWGVISGGAGIALFLVLYLADLSTNQFAQYLGIGLTIVLMVLAHKEFKEANQGFMTFGQGFGIGMTMIVISLVISTVFTYIYVSFVDPGYLDMMLTAQEDQMYERNMDPALIEQSMEFNRKYLLTPGGLAIISVLVGLIGGAVISLIVAAITQKKP